MRCGGPGNPAILEGEIDLELTPSSFIDMMCHGDISLPKLCTIKLDQNRDGDFINITHDKKLRMVVITSRSGHLVTGSKQEIGNRIRILVQKGWKLVISKKQHESWYDYPIDDLFE